MSSTKKSKNAVTMTEDIHNWKRFIARYYDTWRKDFNVKFKKNLRITFQTLYWGGCTAPSHTPLRFSTLKPWYGGFAYQPCLTLRSCRCSLSCQSPLSFLSVFGFLSCSVFRFVLFRFIHLAVPEFPVILREPEVLLLHEHVHDIVLGTASGISHCRAPSSCIDFVLHWM